MIGTVGTKLFFRTLFNLRIKDLRSINAVHLEMKEFLNEMEEMMLLADQGTPGQPAIQILKYQELGEFVFVMHKYLVLLDFSSPLFPKSQCDAIHASMQEFLGGSADRGSLQRLGIDQQVALLRHVQRKHQELSKHL